MPATATLICSPRLTYVPEDAGQGMAPPRDMVDLAWFALFDEFDLRFAAVLTQGRVDYVPYLITSVHEAYRRVTERQAFWQVLSAKRPQLCLLLRDARRRKESYLILDVWALWRSLGDTCADVCRAHIRHFRAQRGDIPPHWGT
jgi:hypothetical protein